jgi:formate-dependent nitrite reductase membrane component NrfD
LNPVGLPDTFFSASPHWEWLIVLYFFVGGIAGGSYFLAALIDFFGRPEDRALARLGYFVAFPAVVLSAILLTLDLGRPLRFWHMLLGSHTGIPLFKWWSPISIGSWALLVFGAFTLVSFLAAVDEIDRVRWDWIDTFRAPHPLGVVWTVLGGILGFFVAGYTGVLLTVTNRPVWADSTLLGLLFLLSGASTAAALLILLARGQRWRTPGVAALKRFDALVLFAELLVLVVFVVWLGTTGVAGHVWVNAWGVLLLVGVFVVGILVPLVVELRPHAIAGLGTAAAALLVLVGGFLLRVVLLFSVNNVGVI